MRHEQDAKLLERFSRYGIYSAKDADSRCGRGMSAKGYFRLIDDVCVVCASPTAVELMHRREQQKRVTYATF